MKITTMLLLISVMTVSAATYAQKITLNERNARLETILDQIRRQSGYNFIYRNDALSGSKPVSLNLKDASLEDALKRALQEQGLTYELDGQTVIIKKAEPTIIEKIKTALAIPVTVSAKVYDESGQPLPGVTVKIKESGNVVITDQKGAFTISVPDNNTVLVFSFIGFETQELAAKDIASGSVITMKASATNLKEVVVNKGYYQEKRELSTGNVSSLTGKEISEQPVSSPLQALEGRIPGLQISQTSGAPGRALIVRLRGQNSISSSNDPLYIINGIPFTSTSLDASNLNRGAGISSDPFNVLNNADIESIDVLKDADATAIYGSRGANGVILITTKKGSIGDVKVGVSAYTGIGQITRGIPLMNTPQYLQMRHEAFKNDGATSIPGYAYDVNGVWDTTRYTNWRKELIGKTAHLLDLQPSISGGNTNTQYLLGFGYHSETTVYPGDFGDKKGSVHLSLNNISDNKKFKVSFNFLFSKDYNVLPQLDFTNFISLPPDAPALYNSTGQLNWENSTWSNPLAMAQQKNKGNQSSLISQMNLSYEIFPGLQFQSNFGYSSTSAKQIITNPLSSYDPAFTWIQSSMNYATSDLENVIIEPQLNFHRKLFNGIFDFILGGTYQQTSQNSISETGTGFQSDALIEDIAAAASKTVDAVDYSKYRYNAIYSRLSYNINDKYLINLTARRDGSSRFGPARQFANFGAIGLGWIFSKEKFVTEYLPFLSFGKIRASYGTTGNDQIGNYQFLDTYSPVATTYLGIGGLTPTRLFNNNFGWEVNKKLEIGLELGFGDKIFLSGSYYKNRSSNELVQYPLASITGNSSIIANLPAIIQNEGVEVEINSINIRSKNFTWKTGLTISVPKNKLVAFPNLSSSSYANQYVVGQPLTIIKRYHVTGVDPQKGIWTFYDFNNDGKTSYPLDLQSVVNTGQKFFGGFQNTFQFKKLTLDVFFQFVKKTGANYLSYNYGIPGTMVNQPIYFLNNWKKPGDNVELQKFTNANFPTYLAAINMLQSDLAYSDASYIRLRTLSLSYDVKSSFMKGLGVDKLRIFMQGQNLLTITNFKGLDPETGSLPPMKVISIGLQANF